MKELEAIYEKGLLRLINPVSIGSDVVKVRIVNRDEILTQEDMQEVLSALSEREKGNFYRAGESTFLPKK